MTVLLKNLFTVHFQLDLLKLETIYTRDDKVKHAWMIARWMVGWGVSPQPLWRQAGVNLHSVWFPSMLFESPPTHLGCVFVLDGTDFLVLVFVVAPSVLWRKDKKYDQKNHPVKHKNRTTFLRCVRNSSNLKIGYGTTSQKCRATHPVVCRSQKWSIFFLKLTTC